MGWLVKDVEDENLKEETGKVQGTVQRYLGETVKDALVVRVYAVVEVAVPREKVKKVW
jgi:hypothetical protein